MTKYSKLNIVYRLQKWMDSVPGQTFLNYAYSWGASVVILGTLFKLTHLPGANIMMFAGMGTEVFVFFLSAFDRPFDKTAIGMDLPTHLDGEEDDESGNSESQEGEHAEGVVVKGAPVGGTIIIGGGAVAANGATGAIAQQEQLLQELLLQELPLLQEQLLLQVRLLKVPVQQVLPSSPPPHGWKHSSRYRPSWQKHRAAMWKS